MSAEAKNLEAITKAIEQHNRNCPFPATEVRMNPFEIDRLGWEEILGLDHARPRTRHGSFRIICPRDGDGEELEAEAIGEPIEIGVPEPQGPPV